MTKFETLELNIDDRGVATISLNRPEVHNAFNEVLINELEQACTQLGQDPDLRVIILRGTGKTFSAGGDLNWMKRAASYTEAENWNDAVKLSDMFNSLNTVPKPVIALVQGAAMGGATGLISCADIAIATADTKFAFSEVKLGLVPATISPFVLAAIGARAARRYFITGERFSAQTAKDIGLVHELVDETSDLDSAAEEIISQILTAGPEAAVGSKKLIDEIAGQDITTELRHKTAEIIAKRRASAEGQEGLSAFLEKRKANWTQVSRIKK